MNRTEITQIALNRIAAIRDGIIECNRELLATGEFTETPEITPEMLIDLATDDVIDDPPVDVTIYDLVRIAQEISRIAPHI